MTALPTPNPSRWHQAWAAFEQLARQSRTNRIADLLADEPDRIAVTSLSAAGLTLDFSRQLLPLAGLRTIFELAEATGVLRWRDAMFAGAPVNTGERRPALHTALRDPSGQLHATVDRDVMQTVNETLTAMTTIADSVRNGSWRGASGRPISDIVHLGIGGSQLGPQLACEALPHRSHPRLRCHFLGNVDPAAEQRALDSLNPLTTLVIVASKSWRTTETARNAQAIRNWLSGAGISDALISRHLIAVSSNRSAAIELGVAPQHVLPCPDWVGGRYSLWSAIGLPVMCLIGPDAFRSMLAGAHAMDKHFFESAAQTNAPLWLALISAWNAQLLKSGTEVVIAYSDPLRRLAAHLQQLEMESNGKSVDRMEAPLTRPSMPVVWGEPGTESQHSFFQALHQGVQPHPADFILVGGAKDSDPWKRGVALRANALAQAQALAYGNKSDDPKLCHPGNRPTTLIHLPRLEPGSFGALIALYEHKTACLGWLWGLNPFDQWGVERGKEIAISLEARLASDERLALNADPATEASLTRLRSLG